MNEERLAEFVHMLRVQGVPVPVSSTIELGSALLHVDPADAEDLYWAARATLVKDPAHMPAFDEVFARFCGEVAVRTGATSTSQADAGDGDGAKQVLREMDTSGSRGPADGAHSIAASAVERLREKRFDRVTAEEALLLIRLIRRLKIGTPLRHTRRRTLRTKGTMLDVRTTLRRATSAGGEPIRPAARGRRRERRPLVMLLDISGSMRAYSRFLLQLAHAASRSGLPAEVFCFGTRLTRVSAAVRPVDPDVALADVAKLVPDWEGGTKIGTNLRIFIDDWGRKGTARGAVVLICSDGMERGEPAELGEQMARLGRLAHEIIWVNPLKGDPRYRPTARGMTAALPHIDVFLPGHNLASLEALAQLLGGIGTSTDASRARS